jgi:uncharacterized protein YbcC (UPF0753/DUF2309 family)
VLCGACCGACCGVGVRWLVFYLVRLPIDEACVQVLQHVVRVRRVHQLTTTDTRYQPTALTTHHTTHT